VIPYNEVVRYQRWRGPCYLHLQCEGWRWRQQGPLQRWDPTTTPHGVTT